MKRPNILVFFNDDHGQWALNAYGNSDLHTPSMDHLAQNGTVMENAYTPIPVCSPARASFFTGLLPSQHGLHDYLAASTKAHEHDWMADMAPLPERLAAAGYQTAMFGKWHLGRDETPQAGFEKWVTLNGDYPILHDGPHKFSIDGVIQERTGYKTQIITDDVVDFLRNRDEDRPFFIFVGYTATHSPWDGQPERLVEHYRRNGFSKLPEKDHYPFGDQALESKELARRDDPAEGMAQYYAAISHLDEGVGRILDELDAKDLKAETLITYTSDHGLCCGHHGIWGKGNGTLPLNMVEESIRIPMIFSMPGTVKEGMRQTQRIDHLDLHLTLLDFAGVSVEGDRYAGASWCGSLRNGQPLPTARPVQYSEYGTVRMARDERYKLVRRYDDKPSNFFDLEADPEETACLLNAQSYQSTIQEMSANLDAFFHAFENEKFSGLCAEGRLQTNESSPWLSTPHL